MLTILVLYYIVSLHQTTTPDLRNPVQMRLYYIVSLHQTTTDDKEENINPGCIISFLYIKPQR